MSKRHRITYGHTCEGGVLVVEYSLLIDFTFCPAEPRTHDEPGYPAHAEDIRVVGITAEIGGESVSLFDVVKHAEELRVFNEMLDDEEDSTFRESVERAIAEHLRDADEDAKEAAAEAKFQAMRDGE